MPSSPAGLDLDEAWLGNNGSTPQKCLPDPAGSDLDLEGAGLGDNGAAVGVEKMTMTSWTKVTSWWQEQCESVKNKKKNLSQWKMDRHSWLLLNCINM